MSSDKISLKFYLNTNKPKGEKYPIYLRILVNRKKVEIATDIAITKDQWDENRQRAKRDNRINESLAEIERDIYDTKYQLNKENKLITAQAIKSYYRKEESLDPALLIYFDSYIERIKKANELEKNTILRYEDTRKHLQQFLETKRHRERKISSIDFKFLSEFDMYLLNQKSGRGEGKNLERNTVNKHHARLKTILIRAINEGYLNGNPYFDFKVKYTPSNRTFLTQEELKLITDYSFNHNKTLDKVKDIFLFSVYTGLRFEDAQNLLANQIIADKKNKYYINIVQDKTKQQQMIPMLQPAIEIFKKYNNDERQITGKVLPKISNQKLNSYLKEIAEIIGITKPLTHHIARHTCATTILLSNDVPIEAVSRWLGHTSIRTTQVYAKITGDYLTQIADQVNKKI